jgi:uncharacterized protein YciI
LNIKFACNEKYVHRNLMGGPLADEGGALLIVNAEDEEQVREKLKNDPWFEHGILRLESVKRWQIFIDQRK